MVTRSVVTSETARLLALETPGSSEAFYRGASEPASATTPAATDDTASDAQEEPQA